MQVENILEGLLGSGNLGKGNKMGQLRKTVHHSEDGGMTG